MVTKSVQSYGFQTYAPLKIIDHGCSWYEDDCRPLMPFTIEFNNPIDAESFADGMLRIEPELLGASVNIYGNMIQINCASEGQTTYRVTVDGDITDIFGQKLGEEEQLRFKVGSADPFMVGPDDNFVTLDPAAKDPVLSLYVMN